MKAVHIAYLILLVTLISIPGGYCKLYFITIFPNIDVQYYGSCYTGDSYDTRNIDLYISMDTSPINNLPRDFLQAVVQMNGFDCGNGGYLNLLNTQGTIADSSCSKSLTNLGPGIFVQSDSTCLAQFDATKYVRTVLQTGKPYVIQPFSSYFNYKIYGHTHWSEFNRQPTSGTASGTKLTVYFHDGSTPQEPIDPRYPNVIYGGADHYKRNDFCGTLNDYAAHTSDYVGISMPISTLSADMIESASIVVEGSSCYNFATIYFTVGYGRFEDFKCGEFNGYQYSTYTLEEYSCKATVDVTAMLKTAIAGNYSHIVARVRSNQQYTFPVGPITVAPTTIRPTTRAPTTTAAPTTIRPTTRAPTTAAPTTIKPTTRAPTTAAPTQKPCPSGYTRQDTYCYKLFTTASSWADASNSCRGQGGYLASIRTWQSNSWINSLVPDTTSEFWIGGYRLNNSAGFKWDDYREWAYTNFDTNQPSTRTNYNYVSFINGSGKWKTALSSDKKPYLCEVL
ncbi:galactose-specific lectin nattectin [Acrasis kona]|uniref:Galactose-specific lectin nattectin n=1 Tax=Acrasis kona TaxID=1008807 RepID=A0AAW2ZQF9_9EUKA